MLFLSDQSLKGDVRANKQLQGLCVRKVVIRFPSRRRGHGACHRTTSGEVHDAKQLNGASVSKFPKELEWELGLLIAVEKDLRWRPFRPDCLKYEVGEEEEEHA